MIHIKRKPMEVPQEEAEVITPQQRMEVKTEPQECLGQRSEEKSVDILIKQEINTSLEIEKYSFVESKNHSKFDSSNERFGTVETFETLKMEHIKAETFKTENDSWDNEDTDNGVTENAIKEEDGSSDMNTQDHSHESRKFGFSEISDVEVSEFLDPHQEIKSEPEVYIDRDSCPPQESTVQEELCVDYNQAFTCTLNLQSHQPIQHHDNSACVNQQSRSMSTQGSCKTLNSHTLYDNDQVHHKNRNECNEDQMKNSNCERLNISSHDGVNTNCLPQNHNTSTRIKGLGCVVCGKKFTCNSYLQRHSRTHAQEKPFQCDVCGNKFTQDFNLRAHKRIHTGSKHFTCTECGAAFTRNSTLQKHKVIHGVSKPYSCMECGAAFTNYGGLQAHKIIHTFTCKECGAAFSTNFSLQRHKIIVHGGSKPFSCMDCGAAFNHSSTLQRHKNQFHTGQTPFECDICGKAFPGVFSLERHKRIHTGQL